VHEPGTDLNHYRILRPLGAGGMGEVYEAEDTKLGRRVALKILPADASTDASRRARFDLEARAVAALNHPNIVTLHSVEEAGHTRFLTMELVDGDTLDHLLPKAGFPLADLLRYAHAIVDAMAAAHERGIVHRDLKPSNVMVTRDGRVKVLDFGVAKLVDLAVMTETNAGTMTASPAVTAYGAVIGTRRYMSPEQMRGEPVDHRSDIFSIGLVLYEMATGVHPLSADEGEARRVITPVRQVRSGIPRAFERLVADCLETDPARRPQTAVELRGRLEGLTRQRAARPGRVRLAIGVTAMVLVLVAGALYMVRQSSSSGANENPGTPTFSRATYERTGIKIGPSLSPDGRELLYSAQATDLRYHIYLRRLDGSGITDLSTGAAWSDTSPSFSPDGARIAFASTRESSQGIFVMTKSGQDARRIVNGAFDPSWTPDGRELVYSTQSGRDGDAREEPSELWAVNLDTGRKRRIAGADAVDPRVSPDGRFVAFWAVPVDSSGATFTEPDRDVWIQPMAGGPRVQVTNGESTDWNPAWSADGRFLFFSSDRSGAMNIWRVAIDQQTGRPVGAPIAITAPSSYVGDMSVGRDGTLAYTAFNYDTAVRVLLFNPATGTIEGPPRDIIAGQRSWLHPDVSPDGRLITVRSFRGQEDVWVVGVDGSGLRPVTNDAARDRGSRWAPDGSLMWYSARGGSYQFWTIRPDGSGARQLTHSDLALNYPLPSHDGRFVAGTSPNTNEQFIFDARDWTKAPERLPSSPGKGQTYLRDWSPDDTRLAAADLSNTLWVFDRSARTWERVGNGAYPRWLPDGRRLVAVLSGRMVLVDTAAKTTRDLYREPNRFIAAVALSPDGRSVYYTSADTQSDIWTMRLAR